MGVGWNNQCGVCKYVFPFPPALPFVRFADMERKVYFTKALRANLEGDIDWWKGYNGWLTL